MAWSSVTTSDALTLTGSFQTVQASAADLEVTMTPGEAAHVQLDYNPQGSPTEFVEWQVLASPDGGTTYDVVAFDAGVLNFTPDPNILSTIIRDIYTFKIQAKLIDTDGTAGGDDTTSTLTVRLRTNNIDL